MQSTTLDTSVLSECCSRNERFAAESQAAAVREQINKFSIDLLVTEAGNQPFGYDPRSYTSYHRQQLLGSKLTNFRQLLALTSELPR